MSAAIEQPVSAPVAQAAPPPAASQQQVRKVAAEKLPLNASQEDMEKAISKVFNRCCPTAIRLHRTLDPATENWQERCTARVIGVRWKNNSAQLMCEWQVGTGVLYTQGTLAFEFAKIYAAAAKSYAGEVTHPNAWKDLIVSMQHVEPPADDAPEQDDAPPTEETWMRIGDLFPKNVRTKVRSPLPLFALLLCVCVYSLFLLLLSSQLRHFIRQRRFNMSMNGFSHIANLPNFRAHSKGFPSPTSTPNTQNFPISCPMHHHRVRPPPRVANPLPPRRVVVT